MKRYGEVPREEKVHRASRDTKTRVRIFSQRNIQRGWGKGESPACLSPSRSVVEIFEPAGQTRFVADDEREAEGGKWPVPLSFEFRLKRRVGPNDFVRKETSLKIAIEKKKKERKGRKEERKKGENAWNDWFYRTLS